jgi:hypothetical protein
MLVSVSPLASPALPVPVVVERLSVTALAEAL